MKDLRDFLAWCKRHPEKLLDGHKFFLLDFIKWTGLPLECNDARKTLKPLEDAELIQRCEGTLYSVVEIANPPEQWVLVKWLTVEGDIDAVFGPYSSEQDATSSKEAIRAKELGFFTAVHKLTRPGGN